LTIAEVGASDEEEKEDWKKGAKSDEDIDYHEDYDKETGGKKLFMNTQKIPSTSGIKGKNGSIPKFKGRALDITEDRT